MAVLEVVWVVVFDPEQPQLQPLPFDFEEVLLPQPQVGVPPQLQLVLQIVPLAPFSGVTPRDMVSL
jgi:hypothetical protein